MYTIQQISNNIIENKKKKKKELQQYFGVDGMVKSEGPLKNIGKKKYITKIHFSCSFWLYFN